MGGGGGSDHTTQIGGRVGPHYPDRGKGRTTLPRWGGGVGPHYPDGEGGSNNATQMGVGGGGSVCEGIPPLHPTTTLQPQPASSQHTQREDTGL